MPKQIRTAAELRDEMQRRLDAVIGDSRHIQVPMPQLAERGGPYLANWTIIDMGAAWPFCDQIVCIAADVMSEYDMV